MNGNEILGKLFGSDAKVRILKLFIFNPETPFDKEEISIQAKANTSQIRREVDCFKKIGLVEEVIFTKEYNDSQKKKEMTGWRLNSNFQFLTALQHLLLSITPLLDKEIVSVLSRAGRLKLVVISGVFIQNFESPLDILIVGDNLSKTKIENTMSFFEAEIGRELRYACFDTKDFRYRYEMYDKLIRNILELDHHIIFDKLNIEKK